MVYRVPQRPTLLLAWITLCSTLLTWRLLSHSSQPSYQPSQPSQPSRPSHPSKPSDFWIPSGDPAYDARAEGRWPDGLEPPFPNVAREFPELPPDSSLNSHKTSRLKHSYKNDKPKIKSL